MIVYAVGIPGSGKTTRALELAADLVAEHGWPLLVVDSTGQAGRRPMSRFVDHVTTDGAGALEQLAEGRHLAYQPETDEDLERVLRGVRELGGCVVVVDEVSIWLTATRGSGSQLLHLVRTHRHAKVAMLFTTQNLSRDIPPEVRACAPRYVMFRLVDERSLERVAELGMDRDFVAKLERFQYVEYSPGFAETAREGLASPGPKPPSEGDGREPTVPVHTHYVGD